MKMIQLLASIALFATLASNTSFASGGHDSVAYDGDVSQAELTPFGFTCTVKVIAVDGEALGLVAGLEQSDSCGGVSSYIAWRLRQLKVGDKVSTDEYITTKPGGSLTLQTADGAIIDVDSDSQIVLQDMCSRKHPAVLLGLIYGFATTRSRPKPPQVPSEPPAINVKTNHVTVVPKGTVYSVDAGRAGGTTDHVVRVYEGTVTLYPNLDSAKVEITDIAREALTLSDDLEKGKITQQEYTRRLMAISLATGKRAEKVQTELTLKAGYECSIDKRGNMTKPKKFK